MLAFRTFFVASVVISLLMGVFLPGKAAALPTANSRPNIVFILTDDLDTEYPDNTWLDHYPRLKSMLADRGTTFRNAFVSLSLCCPSRTSILRGQYAHNTTIFRLDPPNGGFADVYARGLEQSTMATWLQAAGYRTILLGKYLNGYGTTEIGPTYVPPGWNEWYAGVSDQAYKQFDYDLNENGQVVHYGSNDEDYLQDVLRDHALDFLARRASSEDRQPFFMYFSTYSPHLPAPSAPRHANKFADAVAPRPPSFNEEDISDKTLWLRGYPFLTTQEISHIDLIYGRRLRSMLAVLDSIQALIKTLARSGELARTYFVFTSDNGFHMGQHRLTPGKNLPFEEDMRVPLIIRGPKIPAGVVRDEMVLNVDFAPTIAEWAGATTPAFVDGRSLTPLLTAAPEETPAWRTAVLWEQGSSIANVAPAGSSTDIDDPVVSDRLPPPAYRGLRTPQYIYIQYLRSGVQEIYDLTTDPYQLNNFVSTAPAPLLSGLAERLGRYMNCASDSCRTADVQ